MRFEDAEAKALAFRDERDWKQFHNPKDLAVSIAIEAGELLEVFQWSGTDLEIADKSDRIKEELADVVVYCMYLADALGVDLAVTVSEKIDANAVKYPIDKARGSSRKYTEL
jgi:NTP pyrophosphatase (non-canonical NTP hydrolase)